MHIFIHQPSPHKQNATYGHVQYAMNLEWELQFFKNIDTKEDLRIHIIISPAER